MKSDIHPQWHAEAQVSCVCGNTFTVGSTKSDIRVEVCSRCHPFFTGKMKFTTAVGKVERFESKRKKAKEMAQVLAVKKGKKEKTTSKEGPKTLKEMLLGLQ